MINSFQSNKHIFNRIHSQASLRIRLQLLRNLLKILLYCRNSLPRYLLLKTLRFKAIMVLNLLYEDFRPLVQNLIQLFREILFLDFLASVYWIQEIFEYLVTFFTVFSLVDYVFLLFVDFCQVSLQLSKLIDELGLEIFVLGQGFD
jgi:hypothetical protein